ncbi:hypothetical protein CerSpe_147470 [Prunus speciosa]
MNYASRVSVPSAKSPKGASGFPFPGQESHAWEIILLLKCKSLVISVSCGICFALFSESSILTQLKVPSFFLGNGRLEAAVQRLTNLCSVLNDQPYTEKKK